MEKVLINKMDQISERQIAELKVLKSFIDKKLMPAFESLNIGGLTTELLSDILINKCVGVSKLVLIQADKDVSKIRNRAIREQLLNSVDLQIDEFITSSNNIASEVNTQLLTFLTVEAGQIQYIQNAERMIRESNYFFIETEAEKRVYDALCKITEGWNEFYESIGENAKRHIWSLRHVERFLTKDSNGLTIPNDIVDYKTLAE